MQIQFLINHPVVNAIVRDTVLGVLGGAGIDYAKFKGWGSWKDVGAYDWGTASFKWFQGGLIGFVGSAAWTLMFGA